MENRLSFSKIHITEWLWKINPNTGEPDRRTGHETYRELKAILTETGSRMQAVLHRVGSRAAFLSRLKRIEQDFKMSRKVPLLQIETHGDGDGIGLTDDDGLSWPELMEALTPLNVATGVRLPVVLASCHGIWGIKMAQPMERAPFMALLGPNRRVSPGGARHARILSRRLRAQRWQPRDADAERHCRSGQGHVRHLQLREVVY